MLLFHVIHLQLADEGATYACVVKVGLAICLFPHVNVYRSFAFIFCFDFNLKILFHLCRLNFLNYVLLRCHLLLVLVCQSILLVVQV